MNSLLQRIAGYFHSASLLVAILIDWMIFVKGVFVAVTVVGPLVVALLGGVVAGVLVGLIQWKVGGDPWRRALGKGALMAVVVGVPTPTVGTLLVGGGGLLKLASLLAAARKRNKPGPGARR